MIECAKPKLDAQSRVAAAAKEARYAGSNEVDEEGRRLDRRGFDEAKQALWKLSSYQFGYFKRHGRYAANQAELDPAGDSFGELSIQIATSGTSEYWRRSSRRQASPSASRGATVATRAGSTVARRRRDPSTQRRVHRQ